jgi:hypothetical protein
LLLTAFGAGLSDPSLLDTIQRRILERELTEEVPGAVEMLRCPTCLNRLTSGGEKKCPACGTRIRTGRRANVLTDDVVFKRPRVLVERELQARIEAQTATQFWQRRRAARAARRIAALPSSVFENGVVIEPDTGSWTPRPGSLPVIDIPVTAIHETPRVVEIPPPPPPLDDVVVLPDEITASSRRRWRPWKAERNGYHADEPVVDVPVYERPVVEVPEAVVPEVADRPPEPAVDAPLHTASLFDQEQDTADQIEPAPTFVSRIRGRWLVWKSARATRRFDVEADIAPPVTPAAPSAGNGAATDNGATDEAADERAPRFGDHWRTWKPAPPVETAVNGNGGATEKPAAPAAVARPAPPAPPSPSPRPERRRSRPEPREVAPAAHAPRGAENWEPSSSLWANRVFANSRGNQYASWPHPRPEKTAVDEPSTNE